MYYVELIGQKTVNTAKSSVQVKIFVSFREFCVPFGKDCVKVCSSTFVYIVFYDFGRGMRVKSSGSVCSKLTLCQLL